MPNKQSVRLEYPQPLQSNSINMDDVFNDLESDRKKGTLSQKVTSARIYYEASLQKEGYLDRVDSVTGRRETGQFEEGEFRPLDE